MEKLIQRAVPAGTDEKLVQKVLKDFKQHYAEHCKDNTAPYFGINELLWNLRNVGIKTAKNAGVDCISVSWGFREKEILTGAGATKIVNNVTQLWHELGGE